MRRKVRIISFFVAVLAALTGFIVKENTLRKDYQARLNLIYSSALASLNENLENIRVGLKKCIYLSSATMIGEQARELGVSAQSAKNALSVFPAGEKELTQINRFLSHVGSYSSYVAAEAASGKEISGEQRENIQTLLSSAEELYSLIGEISVNYATGINWQENDGDFISDIEQTEDTLTDYPSLIFDGPFSDHLLEGSSKLLESLDRIDEETAKAKIADLLSVPIEKISLAAEQSGAIESFRFSADGTAVSVTKNGGIVSYVRKYRDVRDAGLTSAQCIEHAKAFLYNVFGNKNFAESYFQVQDGLCIINFAYKDGATVCYTDLVKVGVAVDNGEVLFFEADGYIMNHKPRTIATPTHSIDEAREVISGSLSVLNSKQALIPSDGNYEVLCYEFLCEDKNGNKVLVYINTADLSEERLYLVEETENGTFTK